MQKLLILSQKISKYLIAATLIIVPLLPKFPLINIPGTYVAIRFEDLILLALAIILIPKIILDFKSLLHDPIIEAILIFLGVGLLSLAAGFLITKTITPALGILNWARRLEYMIPFLVAYLLIPKEKILECLSFFMKILLIVVFIAFLYGIGEHYLRLPVIITQNNEYSRGIALFWIPGSNTNSTFAGQYDLAAFMVMVIPIFLSIFFVLKSKLTKFATIAVSGTGLWLLVNSFSRISQASYALAISISLLLLKKIKGLVIILIISLVFMASSTGLETRFSSAIHTVYQHIAASKSVSYIEGQFIVAAAELTPAPTSAPVIPVINDVSIAIRLNVEWPRALRAFFKNPFLGSGYSSIGLAADNDYLRMLAETGILGLLAFGLIFFRIGKVFATAFPLREKLSGIELAYIVGMIGAIVGTFVIASFIDLFEASKFATIFWLLLGLALNLIKSKEYEK
jgi:hypothetical protein